MKRIKRSKFDLSHQKKMSLNMGKLYPMFVQEVLPGDRIRNNAEVMIRFAPMLAPVMHQVKCYVHYFHVPWRLVWDNWETFITGGRLGDATPVMPYFTYDTTRLQVDGNFTIGSLSDYLGLPTFPVTATPTTDGETVMSLYHRAYLMIYNEWYRDQNVEAEITVPKTDGDDNANLPELRQIRTRAWRKEYFTSALPFAQRGEPVQVPLEGSGGVVYRDNTIVTETGGGLPPADTNLTTGGLADPELLEVNNVGAVIDNIEEVTLDSANFTINMLRYSLRLQEWLENNARGGARYAEQMKSHFNVVSSDARLQRPEYLGGGIYPVRFSEVLSTAEGETDPLATMGGHGISFGTDNGFSYVAEEHGCIIGIMSLIPDSEYMQGIPRMFSRMDKLDFAYPEFANLGEQEIKNKELYFDPYGVAGTKNGTFGYQSRFAEYKYVPSTVHGEMRDSLDYWHLARKFTAQPSLNADFIHCNPSDRIFAVTGEDVEHLYCQMVNRCSVIRALPYFGVPNI